MSCNDEVYFCILLLAAIELEKFSTSPNGNEVVTGFMAEIGRKISFALSFELQGT